MMRLTMSRARSAVQRTLRNRWVFRLIGIGLFVMILWRIDLGEVLRTLASVDPGFLMLSIAFQAGALVVTTLRWHLIMRRLEIDVPFSRSFVYQLIGTAAALITPGQLGEFVKVLYHRNHGVPIAESVLSVLIDRAYDLLLLLLFGFVAVAILFGVPPTMAIAVAATCGIGLVAWWLFVSNQEKSTDWVARIFGRISPDEYKASVEQGAHRLARRLAELRLDFLILCGLLSVVNYSLLILRNCTMARSVEMDVPFWYFVMVVPVYRLVGLLPISVSGIGTRDVTIIYLLEQVGVPAESSIVFSALGLFTAELQTLVGLLAWWQFPLGKLDMESLSLPGHVASGSDAILRRNEQRRGSDSRSPMLPE